MTFLTSKSVSSEHIKLLGFLEVFAGTIWRLNDEEAVRNLIVDFAYEVEANEKALSFLSETIDAKSDATTANKSSFQVIQQILRKDSPLKVISNSTETLDGIITALLFFNEAVEDAVFNELVSANFLVKKISEGKLFVLRSLSESSNQMLRLSKEFTPGSRMHFNLLKIKTGLDILLRKEEKTEPVKKNVLNDMIFNEVKLRKKLKALQIPENLINGLLSTEVDLNMFQVVIDKWYHTVSSTCDQLMTNKNLTEIDSKHLANNNSREEAICSKLRNIDFPLILLSQLNVSSVFFQVENFSLNELLNSTEETFASIQDAYDQSGILSQHLIQIHRILISLTRLRGIESSQSGGVTDESEMLHNLKKQMCFMNKNESASIQENEGFDLCYKLITKSSDEAPLKEESILKGKFLISPANQLTRSLINQMKKSFGENMERTLLLLKHLKQYLKEECKSALKKSLLNLPFEILQHKWAQIPVESVISVDLNLMKTLSEDVMQFCKDLGNRKYEFQKIIDFLLSFTACFRNEKFLLLPQQEFQRRTKKLTMENRLLAGVDFNQIPKQTVPENLKYSLKLPLNVNNEPKTNFKRSFQRNMNDTSDFPIFIQKKISVLQFMIKESLRKSLLENKFRQEKNLSSSIGIYEFEDTVKLKKTKREVDQNKTNFPVFAIATSFSYYSENSQYYDSVIGSSVIGMFICSSAFFIYGILLLNIFAEEARSISLELKKVYSITFVSSEVFPLLFGVVILLIMTCLLTILQKALNVFPHTSLLVTMALFFTFGANLLVISHILSSFFVSKISSSITFIAIMTLMELPYILFRTQERNTSNLALTLMNVLPPCGFSYGLRSLHQYEALGIGAAFANLWILPTHTNNEISLASALLMQLIGFLIFCFFDLLILAFKKDRLVDSGDKFLNFKIGHQIVQPETTSIMAVSETFDIFQDQSHPEVSVYPTLCGSHVRTLKVIGLQKLIFDAGKTMIIGENITFETYENQIFVLYGPPKSGKTTIISMVAGILQPSSGHICIYEQSQKALRENLQKTVSFCPKISKLPTLITVKECLMIFGFMKGITNYAEVKEEVDSLIMELKLDSWQQVILRDVPNGIQKLVAIATALIGGSKIIALDDPSDQVPYSLKRNLFKVLSKYRKARTILITTGDSEIVELLADLISVIDKGKLLFTGSKKLLMEEFSPGYDVIINNREDAPQIPQREEFEELMEELFQEYFPNASFMDFDNEEREIKFNIPYLVAQLHPESFCYLLRDLEVRKEELGVSYVEVTHPTMSMVLKAVLQQGDTFRQEALLTPEREEIHKRNFNFSSTSIPSTFRSNVLIFAALLNKRTLHNIRNKLFYLQIVWIPILLIISSMLCLWIPPDEDSERGLEPSSRYMNRGIYLIPSFTPWSNIYESRLAKLILQSEEETLEVEEMCEEEEKEIPINILLKKTISSYVVKDKLNCTSCICKDIRCLMKIAISNNRKLLIPFSKRNFRVLPSIEYEDVYSISQNEVVLYFDVDDVTSLTSMVDAISSVVQEEKSPNFSKNLNIASSVQFISTSNQNNDMFSLVHLLATTLFSLLLMAALTLGIVSSAMQMLGEKNQWSVMRAAGVSKLLYTSSFIVWDSLVVLMISFLTVTIAAIFYEPHLVAGTHLSALFLLSFFYGCSLLPVSYILQDILPEENLAVTIVCFCYIGMAVLASALLYFCREFDDVGTISTTGYYVRRTFFSLPSYVFVSGVKSIYFIYSKNQEQISGGSVSYYSPYVWNSSIDLHIGAHFIVLSVWIILGYVILFSLNFKNHVCNFWNKKSHKTSQNQNGVEDSSGITRTTSLNMTVNLQGPLELSFQSLKKECLMIYGENSFDNTMVLRGLAGEIVATDGIMIRLNTERTEEDHRAQLSYFPCEPALDGQLTAEEELQIFSQMRGFHADDLSEVVHRLLCAFNLISVKNLKTKDLSRETKRRICLAKAAIGNPKIVILDDPFRESSPKFCKLIQELIRSVVNANDAVIISSSNLDDMNETTKRLIFHEDGNIIQMGKTNELRSSLKGKYLVKIQTQKLEDLKAILRILKSVETLQITETFHNTIEAKFSCDVSPFAIFGAIAKARETAPFWYEVSSLTLSQYRRSLSRGVSRESSVDAENEVAISLQNLSNGNVSSTAMAFPVFDGRESRDSFYDNQNDDDLLQHKFNLSPRVRRGSHGSAKLTPCSTPLPPRSPVGFRTSFEKLSPNDRGRSVDCSSSTEISLTSESPFKLQMPKKIKRRAGLYLDNIENDLEEPSCSYQTIFGAKEPGRQLGESETPTLSTTESTGSKLILEKFLENLPNVKTLGDEIKQNEERSTKF